MDPVLHAATWCVVVGQWGDPTGCEMGYAVQHEQQDWDWDNPYSTYVFSASIPAQHFSPGGMLSLKCNGNFCGEMFCFQLGLVLPYQLIRGTLSHPHLCWGRLKGYHSNLKALFQLLSVAVNDSRTTACSSQEIWLKLHSYIIYQLFSLAPDLKTTSVIVSFN